MYKSKIEKNHKTPPSVLYSKTEVRSTTLHSMVFTKTSSSTNDLGTSNDYQFSIPRLSIIIRLSIYHIMNFRDEASGNRTMPRGRQGCIMHSHPATGKSVIIISNGRGVALLHGLGLLHRGEGKVKE